MTRSPAENKQTVEALAETIEYEAGVLHGNGEFRFSAGSDRALRELRAALGDLVAQAERVAELEAALDDQAEPIMDERFRDRLLRHALSNEEVGQLVSAIYDKQTRALNALAGDGGGA